MFWMLEDGKASEMMTRRGSLSMLRVVSDSWTVGPVAGEAKTTKAKPEGEHKAGFA